VNIALGPWEPDRAGLDTAILTIAKNAYPNTAGYGPMPQLTTFGSDALPDGCLGMTFAQTNAGSWRIFVGDTTDLYELVAGVWESRTRSSGDYATTTGSFWRWAKWGDLLLAVNGADEPQFIDLSDSGSTEFDDLDGTPPIARDISIVGDFVFLVDATQRNRMIWCGTTGPNTATSWTPGTDLCDEYIAPDGGDIMTAPMLGEYGILLQDDGVARRVRLLPGDPVNAFTVEKIDGIKGCISTYSAAAAHGRIWYLTSEGLYSISPDGTNTPVGAERFNKWLQDNSDPARANQVHIFADPYSTRIWLTFYSSSGASNRDRQIIYDALLDRAVYADDEAVFFAPIVTAGLTLEEVSAIYPDLDTMPVSLDSLQFRGGRATIAAITSDGYLAFITGQSREAVFEVAENEINPDGWTFISEAGAVGKWGDATPTLRIGTRAYSGATQTYAGPFSRDTETGLYYPDLSSRLFTMELTVPADGSWTLAQGLKTVDAPDGER
jgi:hypothetical protein